MKKFLTAFAAIAAGFASQSATASIPKSEPVATVAPITATMPTQTARAEGRVSVRDNAGDLFDFVLKRSEETGQMMAWHESHASHASHASHQSHYSSRY